MKTIHLCVRMLGLAALCAGLQSCGDPKSSSTSGPEGGAVPTGRMTINLTVESGDPQTAVVRANLNDGKSLPTSYRLDGGDYLRACINGLCRTMADNDSIYTPDYIARFDYQPHVDFIVSFNRVEAEDAPDSRVALPPPFTIVTPANHQQVTDGETVVVSWAPTGAPAGVAVSYQGECSFLGGTTSYSSGTLGEDSDADGSHAVSIDPIVTFAKSSTTATMTRCSIDVIVRHELQGRIDPAFDHGTAVGIVSRKVTLDYVPR
ncbi:MAG TPA: hypothetical protein VFV88_04420 [Steroidobacteraceae bacterium]|nr:hypothetical protein [Steroidobacteraceae bacterium]